MPVEERWLLERVKGGHIARDAPCAACGYNLVGLKRTGVCPECGTPMRGQTMHALGHDLRHMPRGVLWSFAIAALWMAAGTIVMSVAWPLTGLFMRAGAPLTFTHVALGAAALGSAAWLVGVVILSLYRPPDPEETLARSFRHWAMPLLAMGTQSLWLASACLLFVRATPFAAGLPVNDAAVACGLLACLGLAPTILLLRRLLASANDDALRKRLLVLSWALPSLLALKVDDMTVGLMPAPVAIALSFGWILIPIALMGLVVWLTVCLFEAAHIFRWSVRHQRDAAKLLEPDPRFRLPEDGPPIPNPIPNHTASPKLFGGR